VEIDLEAVRVVFCDVLGGRMTREAADRWAWGVMQLSEAGSLTFSPVNAKSRIWEGVMYLYGIDMMDGPAGQYIFTEEDIRSAMAAKLVS
jgi:hypothetical protein